MDQHCFVHQWPSDSFVANPFSQVCRYLRQLDLDPYIGAHDPKHVVVLADSGYDTKDIEKTIASKTWHYIIALKKKRTVKTVKRFEGTPKSKGWLQIAVLFKKYRCLKWSTVRVPVNSTRKKRMEFRVRQITGYLRNVGKTQLICSEFKKRPQGRRKYLACKDFKATPPTNFDGVSTALGDRNFS